MGLFKKIEEMVWTGKTIKDYGIIDENKRGITKFKHSVLLTEKKGKKKLIIKESVTAVLGANIRYFEFDKIGVQKLKDVLEDSLKLMEVSN